MTAFSKPTALEFFAGGGLARLGIGHDFDTIWANDIDPIKAKAWRENFGDAGFVGGDIASLDPAAIPTADLAWASFPCQDLSLAGARGGLAGARSGAFFAFLTIIETLQRAQRAPKVLVIENVTGLLTSHGGQDFALVLRALGQLGYRAGAIEIDARHFVPQSRPRIFIVAVSEAVAIPEGLLRGFCVSPYVAKAFEAISSDLARRHLAWHLPDLPTRAATLKDIIDPDDQNWWSPEKTKALLAQLSPRHLAIVQEVQRLGKLEVGAVYRRTRTKKGVKATFAEVRFDGLAGCLRTPSGGSSRQFLMFVDGFDIKVRALNARESLMAMGVDPSYKLPKSQAAGLKIAGDGVAVPVVAWLSRHLLAPLVTAARRGVV